MDDKFKSVLDQIIASVTAVFEAADPTLFQDKSFANYMELAGRDIGLDLEHFVAQTEERRYLECCSVPATEHSMVALENNDAAWKAYVSGDIINPGNTVRFSYRSVDYIAEVIAYTENRMALVRIISSDADGSSCNHFHSNSVTRVAAELLVKNG